jgi:hypothetical protein
MITRRGFLGLSAGGALVASGYGLYSNLAEVVEVALPLHGLRRDVRVLFLADLHMPRCFVTDRTLLDAAETFRPHLVLIGGDSVDKPGNESLVHRFGGLEAEFGKFAILGNREYLGGCDLALLRRYYARAGVQLLVNETAVLQRLEQGTIRIVGLDDLMEGCPRLDLVTANESCTANVHAERPGTRRSAAAATGGLPASAEVAGADELPVVPSATIVLAHCPALFDRLPPIPLFCLSGHTHGGQIAPFGLALYRPMGSGRYVYGAYRASGGRQLYVTRGLGNNGIPFRIGARPEIVQLTLLPALPSAA